MRQVYTFREITETNELEQFFKLRYDIYSSSVNRVFLKDNERHLDIDQFDIHARHYSLLDGENKAGYLRIIFPKEKLTNKQVIEIGEKYSLIDKAEYLRQNGKAIFPFLSYIGVPQSHWQFFNKVSANGERIVEGSRLILCPQYRSIRTSKFLVECAIVLCLLISIGQKYAIVNCNVEHGPFYEHYGFKEICDSGGYTVKGVNKTSLSIALALSSVPEQYHDIFETMADEFKKTGKIERHL